MPRRAILCSLGLKKVVWYSTVPVRVDVCVSVLYLHCIGYQARQPSKRAIGPNLEDLVDLIPERTRPHEAQLLRTLCSAF
jgi:hypothetical protein